MKIRVPETISFLPPHVYIYTNHRTVSLIIIIFFCWVSIGFCAYYFASSGLENRPPSSRKYCYNADLPFLPRLPLQPHQKHSLKPTTPSVTNTKPKNKISPPLTNHPIGTVLLLSSLLLYIFSCGVLHFIWVYYIIVFTYFGIQ